MTFRLCFPGSKYPEEVRERHREISGHVFHRLGLDTSLLSPRRMIGAEVSFDWREPRHWRSYFLSDLFFHIFYRSSLSLCTRILRPHQTLLLTVLWEALTMHWIYSWPVGSSSPSPKKLRRMYSCSISNLCLFQFLAILLFTAHANFDWKESAAALWRIFELHLKVRNPTQGYVNI